MSKEGKDRPPGEPKTDEFGGLSLEDTFPGKARGPRPTRKPGQSGYNPYDADVVDKNKATQKLRKPTDLRKLSEWIRLKREVEALEQERKKPESED